MSGAEPPAPTPAPTRRLPFKRTVKRKSTEDEHDQTQKDDDGLSLFSRRAEFFPTVVRDQQRRAAERAEQKEKERQAQLAREAEESEIKRRRVSPSDDENDEAQANINTRETSSIEENGDEDAAYQPSRRSRESLEPSQSRNLRQASAKPVISLDDSDEDIIEIKPEKIPSPLARDMPTRSDPFADDLDDPTTDIPGQSSQTAPDDITSKYVKRALERAEEKRKREQMAAESGEQALETSNTAVELLIVSNLGGIHQVKIKRKLHQPLKLVHDTWAEMQIVRFKAPYTREELAATFFTWKGNKIYGHTTLESLGIKPCDASGRRLLPLWERGSQDGYDGHDKVLLEAWTQSAYEDHQRAKERERLRARGELSGDDDDDQDGGNQAVKREDDGGDAAEGNDDQEPEESNVKIKIKLTSREHKPVFITVRKSHTIGLLSRAYQRQAQVPDDRDIRIQWDGEFLDPSTTIGAADMEDMDTVEVYT